MIRIPNSETIANLKKGYVIIFILGTISLVTGFTLTSLIGFIPYVEFGDPGRDEYLLLIANLETLSTLFMNLGLGLFLLSTFVGATTDKRFSIEIRRGLLMASVLGVIALAMFNYIGLFILINYF